MCWECDHPDSTPLDYLGHMREPIACYGWAVQGRCSGQYGVTRRMTPDSAAADGMAETRGRAREAGMHRQARGSGLGARGSGLGARGAMVSKSVS
jgi:hypothetical protein